jgi:shikimate kinase
MGSGKSRLGRYLANTLKVQFEDLDDCIQTELKLSISQIFGKFGQDYFRAYEQDLLYRKLKDPNRVLALGGGSLSTQELVDSIKEHNVLVFIAPDFEDLISRIQGKSKRPLVMHADGTFKTKDVLKADLYPLYESRLEYYNQAHIQFKPQSHWTAEQSGAELIKLISEFNHEV